MRAEAEAARPDRDHIAALQARMFDFEPAARTLQLTQQRRKRSRREILEPAQDRRGLEIDRLRHERAGGGRGRIGEPRREIEHGPARRRVGIEPHMQFHMLGGQQGLRTGRALLVEPELIDRERDALGGRRQPADAGLCQRPVGDERHSAVRRLERERRLDFRDQQIGPVDLRYDEEVLGCDHERGIGAAHLRPRRGAAHLDAERIAGEVLGRTGVEAAGLRLARAPGRDRGLGHGGGMKPQGGPSGGKRHEQGERQNDLPGPAGDGAGMDHPCLHRREMWPEQGSFSRVFGPPERANRHGP